MLKNILNSESFVVATKLFLKNSLFTSIFKITKVFILLSKPLKSLQVC